MLLLKDSDMIGRVKIRCEWNDLKTVFIYKSNCLELAKVNVRKLLRSRIVRYFPFDMLGDGSHKHLLYSAGSCRNL